MTSSLVGSEMCIRDRYKSLSPQSSRPGTKRNVLGNTGSHMPGLWGKRSCLLYTSDAADDM
eukprot:5971053-Prorocentrum_lima.AAC.1